MSDPRKSGPKSEIFISYDFECVAPAGQIGAINVGLIAATSDGVKLDEGVSINFKPGYADPRTLEWWLSDPQRKEAYRECTADPVYSPVDGMQRVKEYIERHAANGKVILIAAPTLYDGRILATYWDEFVPEPIDQDKGYFPYDMVDVESFAAGKLGLTSFSTAWREVKKMFPRTDSGHTGLSDAIYQLDVFLALYKMDSPKDLTKASRGFVASPKAATPCAK
jgi:hypothetical protein